MNTRPTIEITGIPCSVSQERGLSSLYLPCLRVLVVDGDNTKLPALLDQSLAHACPWVVDGFPIALAIKVSPVIQAPCLLSNNEEVL